MYIDALMAMPYVCRSASHPAWQASQPAAGHRCKRDSGVNGAGSEGRCGDPTLPPPPLVATVPCIRLLRSIPLKRFLATHPLLFLFPTPRGIYKNLYRDTNVLISVYTTCERSQNRLNSAHEQAEGTGLHQEPHQAAWCVA
jgi:hypothetical protein